MNSRFKCNDCGIEITPVWTHAIYNNSCPACGGKLMDEETEELLKGLSEAIQEMKPDPICLAGWIVSNYYIKKVGDCEPTEFYTQKKKGNINPNGTITQKQDRLKDFFKNAGVNLDEIKNIKKPDNTKLVVDEGVAEENTPEDIEMANSVFANNDISLEDIEGINDILNESSGLVDPDAGLAPAVKNLYMDVTEKQMQAQQAITSGGVRKNSFRRAG